MIAVWLALVAHGKRPEPASVPAPPVAVDFWSPAGLSAALDEIVPAIERQSGRTFRSRPAVELQDPAVFSRILAEEEQLLVDAILRDTPPELRRPAEQSGVVPGLLGKYAVFDDTLFLCRDEIESAAAQLGVDEPTRLARVILVHELVHALHDQQTDLAAQLRAVPDLDAFRANQSTAEGLATWVTERVAAELGWTEDARRLERLQGWDDSGLVDKSAFPVWAAYGLGRDSIRAHFEHGGFDEVWRVAVTPPLSSSGVFDPTRAHEPRPTPSRDWYALLRGTEKKLTDGDWVIGISILGDYDLVGEAIVGGNVADLAEVAKHLREAWHLVGTMPERDGEIRVLVFDAPAWPLRYLTLLEAQQTAEAERMSVPGRSEVDIRYTPWDRMPGDRAVLRDSRLVGAPGVFTERHAGWVVRGDTLVVVSAGRFRPGLRLGWTVEEVFARLAAPTAAPAPE